MTGLLVRRRRRLKNHGKDLALVLRATVTVSKRTSHQIGMHNAIPRRFVHHIEQATRVQWATSVRILAGFGMPPKCLQVEAFWEPGDPPMDACICAIGTLLDSDKWTTMASQVREDIDCPIQLPRSSSLRLLPIEGTTEGSVFNHPKP